MENNQLDKNTLKQLRLTISDVLFPAPVDINTIKGSLGDRIQSTGKIGYMIGIEAVREWLTELEAEHGK